MHFWNQYYPVEYQQRWDRWKLQERRYSSTIHWRGRKSQDYSGIHMILNRAIWKDYYKDYNLSFKELQIDC